MINKYLVVRFLLYVKNVTEFDAIDLGKQKLLILLAQYHKQMNAVDYPRALKRFGTSFRYQQAH